VLNRFHHFGGLLLVAIVLLPGFAVAQQEQDETTTFPLKNFYAKIKKRPRSLLHNVHFGLSTGYGNTYMSHTLDGFGIYQPKGGGQPSIFQAKSSTSDRYSNWVNQSATVSSPIIPGSFLVSSDSSKLGFKGNAMNIPLKATVHFEFMGRYRVGAGYSYEYMSLGAMHATSFGSKIGAFQPASSTGFMSKYFGMIGASFYRSGNYLFTGDAQLGGFNPGANFSTQIQKGIYVNLGVMIERELSEYLRIFIRPSYEIKSYTLTLPEVGKTISHGMNVVYINVGLSYSIPEIPKCRISGCRIQMNHAHGDREYRSRVHPIYKKQNPQYGENHPKLFRYKGKNSKKLNPY